ncbi:MAG: alpha/beta fold hydrolase [Chloroflexota bacterium]
MRLAVQRWPDTLDAAAPTVLLVHGITASSGTWWRVAPALVDAGWQVLAVDLALPRCLGLRAIARRARRGG